MAPFEMDRFFQAVDESAALAFELENGRAIVLDSGAPAKVAERLEHLQERLRRQVLGVVPVADAHVQVAVDAVEMQ